MFKRRKKSDPENEIMINKESRIIEDDRFSVEDIDKGVFLAEVRVTRKKDK